jgi:hypothetical protein
MLPSGTSHQIKSRENIMTNATSVAGSSTPMPAAPAELIPGRRTFLAQAAGSLVFVTTGTAMGGTADPIFAAIENHKAAFNKLSAQVSEHSRLESSLPREKRKSTVHG